MRFFSATKNFENYQEIMNIILPILSKENKNTSFLPICPESGCLSDF